MSGQNDAARPGGEADLKVDPKADAKAVTPGKTTCDVLAAFDAEAAALPVVEAPSVSPDASAPAPTADAVAVDAAPSIAPAESEAKPVAAPNASQRFRTAAAAQIAAARDRITERNKSPVIAVALIAGLTGAGASTGVGAMVQNERIQWESRAIADAIAKLDDSIVALRASVQQSAELTAAQFVSTGEKLAQIEKAQEQPSAQIIKLSEAVEKLRETNAAFASRLSARESGDSTGSLKSMPTTKAGKVAIVEGWSLKDLDQDTALLEGRHGLFETTIGEIIPGVGRVEGFRKQDGRWVVVTARGLIVTR